MDSNSIIIKLTLIEKQVEFYIPHPHLGGGCNKAKGSLLASAAPPPQSVRHWTPAPRVGIPAAGYQQVKNKAKQGSVPNPNRVSYFI